MSERIQKLCLQAADGTVDPNSPFTPEEVINLQVKLAELIVRECVNQCRQQWYDANNDPSLNAETDPRKVGIKIGIKQGALKCIDKINTHFGVKE
jgi:hypothetical protein